MLGSQGRHLLLQVSRQRMTTGIPIVRGFAAVRRDPPLAPLTNPVENAIEAARRRGDFKDLSGAGKPLPKGEVMPVTGGGGSSTSDLLSRKAEFEMRRAIRNRDLEQLGGKGEKLKYTGTAISAPTIGDSMGNYILDQADLSAEDMKKVK